MAEILWVNPVRCGDFDAETERLIDAVRAPHQVARVRPPSGRTSAPRVPPVRASGVRADARPHAHRRERRLRSSIVKRFAGICHLQSGSQS